MKTRNKCNISAMIGIACALGTSVAIADDTYRMQIHPKEVPGTWELVHGQYDRAITLLEIAASKSNRTNRDFGAITNNLCVAYTRTADFARAQSHCNRAVDFAYPPGLALNNRGVLLALRGDIVAAAADFEAAKRRRESAEAANFNSGQLYERVSEVTKTSPANASLDSMA